jgi:hypothetical protein
MVKTSKHQIEQPIIPSFSKMGKGSRVFSMIVVLATCQVLSAFRMDGARADFKSTPVFMTTTLAPTSPKFEVQEAVEPNLLTYDSVSIIFPVQARSHFSHRFFFLVNLSTPKKTKARRI